jgi:hypothetical protein
MNTRRSPHMAFPALDTLVAVALLTLAGLLPAAGIGTGFAKDPWSTSRVRQLPPEVRARIERSAADCEEPRAARASFDRYIQDRSSNDRFIALHFHDLRCNSQVVCKPSGCLQVYVSKGGPYRLVFNAYVSDVELKHLGSTTAVEITCESLVRNAREFSAGTAPVSFRKVSESLTTFTAMTEDATSI